MASGLISSPNHSARPWSVRVCKINLINCATDHYLVKVFGKVLFVIKGVRFWSIFVCRLVCFFFGRPCNFRQTLVCELTSFLLEISSSITWLRCRTISDGE